MIQIFLCMFYTRNILKKYYWIMNHEKCNYNCITSVNIVFVSNDQVELKLAERLKSGLQTWTSVLLADEEFNQDLNMDTDEPKVQTHALGGDPHIKALVFELRITNQEMYLDPSLEHARFHLLQELFAWKQVILSLPRILHSRYQVRTAAAL